MRPTPKIHGTALATRARPSSIASRPVARTFVARPVASCNGHDEAPHGARRARRDGRGDGRDDGRDDTTDGRRSRRTTIRHDGTYNRIGICAYVIARRSPRSSSADRRRRRATAPPTGRRSTRPTIYEDLRRRRRRDGSTRPTYDAGRKSRRLNALRRGRPGQRTTRPGAHAQPQASPTLTDGGRPSLFMQKIVTDCPISRTLPCRRSGPTCNVSLQRCVSYGSAVRPE